MAAKLHLAAILAASVLAQPSAAQEGGTGNNPGLPTAENHTRTIEDPTGKINTLRDRMDQTEKPKGKRTRAAIAADLTPGAPVHDRKGKVLATVEGQETDGIILVAPRGKVKVPADAFGVNRVGLFLGISSEEFDSLVVGAVGS